MRSLEILSPARNAEVGRIAILAGADAVYIGAPSFGARAAAGNSVDDIRQLCTFAHQFRAKVYVTMNTILFDNELAEARELVCRLYAAGVDALIVQDMAYLEMDLPPIALHASTQCDIRTPAKARMLAQAGFSQLVLPREFSLSQIRDCSEAAGVPVEVFVHGALCVSYSGDCQAGCVAMDRSANRGVCPQMCRLPYELIDSEGRAVSKEKHYLSLRDLNRIDDLELLIDAGASSFKIEGRLKDSRYVANVTAAYSQALDALIADNPELRRASFGRSECAFNPDLKRTFNRGYTSYFLGGRPSKDTRMASLDSPKWVGEPIAEVITPFSRKTRSFKIRLFDGCKLCNGDGIGFFTPPGRFEGFRLNRISGTTIFTSGDVEGLSPETVIYRNNDKAFTDILDRPDASCRRKIDVNFEIKNVDANHFTLTASDERGCTATTVVEYPYQQAKRPQSDTITRILSKLGGTIYEASPFITIDIGDRFIPASVLTEARRKAIELLDCQASATYHYDRRKDSVLTNDGLSGKTTTYHDNVSNHLARHFYESHGAVIGQEAIEVRHPEGEIQVMSTRYCIRLELGACLREKTASRLPSPLFLRNPSGLYRLDFDCAECGMKVVRQ